MKIENLLNTLILSLSVSTVLITLLSYFIYKIRQFPKKGATAAAVRKKEGVFFRRHIPVEVVLEVEEKTAPEQKNFFSKMNTLPFYFFFVLLVVFSSLVFKDFFSTRYAQWSRAQDVKHLHDLREKGLFKMYDLDLELKDEEFAEVIPAMEKKLVDSKLALLKTKKIALVSWSNNQKHNATHASRAQAGWESFFKSFGLTYTVVSDLAVGSFDLFIIPQMKSLSETQRAFIAGLEKSKTPFLMTGPCGALDGTGAPAKEMFCEKILKTSFLRETSKSTSRPSLFPLSTTPGWSVPPGHLTNWFPEDEEFTVVAESGEASIVEAQFNGKPRVHQQGKVVRALFKDRHGWLALEPHSIAAMKGADKFYGDSVLIETLSWLAGVPRVQVAPWKDGKRWTFAVSVDSEDKIEGSFELWERLDNHAVPATFFVVSDQLQNDDRLMKVDSPKFEIGSHSKDHMIHTEKDLSAQFLNMQDSRLTLEELSGQPVVGFHPPEERFDETTVNAIAQNRFSYFSGDQRIYRMAPLFVPGNLLYLPRVFMDDVLIKRNRQLITNDDILLALRKDYLQAADYGGLHYFNVHSQIMGQSFYLDVFDAFMEEISKQPDVWVANLGEINTWWRQRNALEVTLSASGVKVRNTSAAQLVGLVVYMNGKKVALDPIDAGAERVLNDK